MAKAEITKSLLTFLWRIENLSHFDSALHGIDIESPVFAPRNLEGSEWTLTLFPNGVFTNDPNLRVRLEQRNAGFEYRIDCEFSFLDNKKSPILTGTMRNAIVREGKPLYLPMCATVEEVFTTKKSSYLPQDTLSMQCLIWKYHGEPETTELVSACSRVQVREESTLFRLEGFSQLGLNTRAANSVKAYFPYESEHSDVGFLLSGTSLMESSLHYEVHVRDILEPFFVKVKLELLNNDHNPVKCVQFNHVLDQLNYHSVQHVVERSEIMENLDSLLLNDVLTLHCEFKASRKNISGYIDKTNGGIKFRNIGRPTATPPRDSSVTREYNPESIQWSDHLVALGKDLLSAFRKSVCCDYEIRTGTSSFPVHRAILCARSEGFSDILNDKSQSHPSFIYISDLDHRTVELMLTYIYGGILKDLCLEDAFKLYYAAVKYKVLSLKRHCSVVFKSSVKVERLVEVLKLVHEHQDEELMSFIHDFIIVNFNEIKVSSEWIQFCAEGSELYLKIASLARASNIEL